MNMEVCIVCNQTVEIHFPAHFHRVYLNLLPERGYKTKVIAFTNDIDSETSKALIGQNVRLFRKPPRKGLWSLFYAAIVIPLKVFYLLSSGKEYNSTRIYMVHNDPYIGFIVWLISKWRKSPFIFRITHLIPEEVMMRKAFMSRITGSVTKYIRDALSRKSNYVLPTSEEMKRTLIHSASISEDKCVVLPATVDVVNQYKELACHSFVEQTRKKLEFVGCEKWLVYIGTLSPSRQLKLIIDCLSVIRGIHKGKSVGLAVLGVSSVKSHLHDLVTYAETEGVSEAIAWCDPVPDECLPDCISMMDVGLSPFPLDPVMRNNSPLKSLEYLRSGVCVVASKIPESVYIIEESKGGLLADFNARDFAKAASSLLFEDKKKRDERVLESKKWIQRNRDISTAADIIEQVFLDCEPLSNG